MFSFSALFHWGETELTAQLTRPALIKSFSLLDTSKECSGILKLIGQFDCYWLILQFFSPVFVPEGTAAEMRSIRVF